MAKLTKLGTLNNISRFQSKMTAAGKEKEKVEDVEMKDAEEEKVENLTEFFLVENQ